MKIRPLADRVVVKRVLSEEKSRGGIIIPDTAKEKSFEGEVIAVGAGRRLPDGKRRSPIVKAGDRILFGKHAGSEVVLAGVTHVVLREEDILAVVGELPGKDDTDVK
jgi:chaperonin GroES